MIVERHYDDEALIAILGSEGDGGARDPHLAVCKSCAETLASYRSVAGVLGAEAVWDLKDLEKEPAPLTAKSLRAFAVQMNADDRHAEELLEDLLSRPRGSWLTTVQNESRFTNPGLVRLLVERSEATLDKTPPDATAMVRAAVDIAERLDSQQLRGAAWRQYAYSLFYTGDYTNAADAADLAHSAFEKCSVADYDLARVGIVRALIYTAQERYAEAHAVSQWSARIFQAYGDRNRLASAKSAAAYSLLWQSRYQEALPILIDIEKNFQGEIEPYSRAVTAGNIAMCYWQTGRVADALTYYQIAMDSYEQLGIKTEATRVKASVAGLLASQGQYVEAERRLRECLGEFAQLGMRMDVVYSGLELAEILLVENRDQEVEALCHSAMQQFQRSGIPHSAPALVALTYLREAAKQKRATPEIARHVKTYIERLPRQPELLFAPPPLPPE